MNDANAQMKEAMKDMPPEQQAMMKQMMGEMFAPMKVQKPGKSKTILGYKCEQYTVNRGGKQIMELWVTKDIDLGTDYFEFMKHLTPGNNEIFSELAEIKGVPLESISMTDIAGVRSESKDITTEIKKADIDDSEFIVPKGYSKKEFNPSDITR